jgi:hypothetical protein
MKPTKLIHIGRVKPRLSKSRDILIPRSISTTLKGSDEWLGATGNRYEITLSPRARFLHISYDKFFKFGKELDSPINRGKLIAKYAKKHKYNVIVIDKRIYGLREFAIISMKAISKIEKVKPVSLFDESLIRKLDSRKK